MNVCMLCPCMYEVHVCTCVPTFACVEARGYFQVSSSITLNIIFGTGSLTESGTHHCLTDWQISASQSWDYRALSPCLAFDKVSEDLPLVLTLYVWYLTLRVISLVPDVMFTVLLIRQFHLGRHSECLKSNPNSVTYKHKDLFILHLKLLPLFLCYYNIGNNASQSGRILRPNCKTH